MCYETTAKPESDAAIALAERFFAGRFGLTVQTRSPRAIGFEGGGGHVVVAITGERPTTLDIQTREWDEQVAAFMRALPR
jgi:hypothetical protein